MTLINLLVLYMYLVKRLVLVKPHTQLSRLSHSTVKALLGYNCTYSRVIDLSTIIIGLFYHVHDYIYLISRELNLCLASSWQSVEQVSSRAERMKIGANELYLYAGTDIEVNDSG